MNDKSTFKTTRVYRILSPVDRKVVMIGYRNKESIRSIARSLNRQPSVISRGITANLTEDGKYHWYWAQKRFERRRRKSRQKDRMRDPEVRAYLEEKLKEEWSPVQIAGRLPVEKVGKKTNHETIYQYIFKVGRTLIPYLL